MKTIRETFYKTHFKHMLSLIASKRILIFTQTIWCLGGDDLLFAQILLSY